MALGVYAASLGYTLAPSLGWLVAFRVLRGSAAGAGVIVGRALIRDP